MDVSEIIHKIRANKLVNEEGLLLVYEIEKHNNINLLDNDNRTILHHICIAAINKKFDSRGELLAFTDFIKKLTKVMSDQALHEVDNDGNNAVNIASKCNDVEISYALLNRDPPSIAKLASESTQASEAGISNTSNNIPQITIYYSTTLVGDMSFPISADGSL